MNGIAASAYALGDYYMYDPAGNTWVSAPGLQGPPRSAATAFSFGDSAYLVGGANNDGYAIYRFVDEFKPIGMTCTAYDTARIYDTTHISVNDTLFITITVGIAPNTTLNTLDVYPNPGHNQIYINTGNYASMSGYTLNITNTLGQSVFSSSVNRQLFAISTSTWSPGVYFLKVIDPNSTVATAKEIVVQ